MTIEEILKRREELWLEFAEPWEALESDGRLGNACMIRRVSVDDAIRIARYCYAEVHPERFKECPPSEADLLSEFIAVHWCAVVEREPWKETVRRFCDKVRARAEEVARETGEYYNAAQFAAIKELLARLPEAKELEDL